MFESGFLHSGSRLAATKPKDALTEAQVHFKSRSQILPVEQAVFTKLSQHFDLIWKSRAEETKSREESGREERGNAMSVCVCVCVRPFVAIKCVWFYLSLCGVTGRNSIGCC